MLSHLTSLFKISSSQKTGGYLVHPLRTALLDRALEEAAKRHGLDALGLFVYVNSHAAACDTDRLISAAFKGTAALDNEPMKDIVILEKISFEDLVAHFTLAIGRAKWTWWYAEDHQRLTQQPASHRFAV